MLRETYPLFLGGRAVQANFDLPVLDKFSGEEAARVAQADPGTLDAAIAAAAGTTRAMAALPPYARQAALEHCARRFEERAAELARVLCIEAGKPIRDARGEVGRLIETFKAAAAEVTRPAGEVLAMASSPRLQGYRGQWKRVPIGACSLIAPFNFPLNLAAHKIAPAIAAGCPFVLKPASATPISALLIGEVLAETDLPEGSWSIVPCPRAGADALASDDRLKLLSFTGSPAVGWAMKARAGKKKVVLELGGNAACVVDETADLEKVVPRLITGAFYQSGQSCISVQRIIAHSSIYAELRERLVAATNKLRVGDPRDEDTFIGPIISEKEAGRIAGWIDAAVKAGARLLCGGQRDGVMVAPTLLENVPRDQPIAAEEAFGPVALLQEFASFDEALWQVNDSKFGLQAGVFTRDIDRMHQAWDSLEVGGVIINDVPSFRADPMPYGGVKESGLGREGLRFAIEDMSEIRMLVVR
ncbi:aldehyde dehydrogenase family protein [Nannocystis sp. ILAH1]|uniref:aldehyde dehydrogenase family protein n=1 Tax=unclassified Nannocystis TaxID=2627009 RepID=UPI00226EEDA5|nr:MULTISPECIES: aldehyde dehydrogenase family protein [unclassified Nannocystis]MCY0993389.1 aldehyde dehydrogenase family protein [Nannocystis sp. ILAH1]MCY1063883.1 aldehyde dehydrogenase family protein [Nannocystis sp. RBIL2]